jgi:hypothetical protein
VRFTQGGYDENGKTNQKWEFTGPRFTDLIDFWREEDNGGAPIS